MCKEVGGYFKTCDSCQKMRVFFSYSFSWRAFFAGVFDTFAIDLPKPLSTTTHEMKLLLLCSNRSIDCFIVYLVSSAVVSEVIAFFKQHVTFSFGRPRLTISDDGSCSAVNALGKLPSRYRISWKAVLTYALPSKCRAEKLICTTKISVGEIVHRRLSDWDLGVLRVLHGYRRRSMVSGFSFFIYYIDFLLECLLNICYSMNEQTCSSNRDYEGLCLDFVLSWANG